MKDYTIYWNKCWEEEAPEELYKYLDMYREKMMVEYNPTIASLKLQMPMI